MGETIWKALGIFSGTEMRILIFNKKAEEEAIVKVILSNLFNLKQRKTLIKLLDESQFSYKYRFSTGTRIIKNQSITLTH